MEELLSDLRHSLRVFARAPWFSGAMVLLLGLGIGANTVVFTAVNATAWRYTCACAAIRRR